MSTDNKTSSSEADKPSKQVFPLGDVTDCPINLLELDKNNPRLMTGTNYQIESEVDLVKVICSISDVRELVISICDNGYLNLEPLIIYSKDGKPPFQVLEGNRRLTAIKLIRNNELASAVGMSIPTVREPLIYSTKPGHSVSPRRLR